MCVASIPVWAVTTASQAGYATCVASCPYVGLHDRFASWVRQVRRFSPHVCHVRRFSLHVGCFVRRFALYSFEPATAPCPNAGEGRDGEHPRAAMVHAGGTSGPC